MSAEHAADSGEGVVAPGVQELADAFLKGLPARSGACGLAGACGHVLMGGRAVRMTDPRMDGEKVGPRPPAASLTDLAGSR